MNFFKATYCIFLIFIMLLSCRKEENFRYKIPPEFFVGEWEWSRSYLIKSVSDQYGNHLYFEIYDSIYPYDHGKDVDFNASIIITPKGTTKFMIDDIMLFKIPANKQSYWESNTSVGYRSDRLKSNENGISILDIYDKDVYSINGNFLEDSIVRVLNFPFGYSTMSYRDVSGGVFNIFVRK